MTSDWVDITGTGWDELVQDAYAFQHAVVREFIVRADDFVLPDLGWVQRMTARSQVLVQLQEADIPSIVLWFEGVTRIEYRPDYDAEPAREPSGRGWTFQFPSFLVEAERAFATRPGSVGLGTSISVDDLVNRIADPE